MCLLLVCFLRESLVFDTNPHRSQVKPPVLRCLASTWVFALQAKLKLWLQAAQENPPSTGIIMLLMASFKSEHKSGLQFSLIIDLSNSNSYIEYLYFPNLWIIFWNSLCFLIFVSVMLCLSLLCVARLCLVLWSWASHPGTSQLNRENLL